MKWPTSRIRAADVLVWSAALAFCVSWFLPVLPDVPGWMAFRYALAPLVPYGDAGSLSWDDHVPQVMSALTNLVFLILLGLWMFGQMFRPGMFVRIALACVLLNLYWLVRAARENGLQDLLVGYYVWLAAYAMMLAAAVFTAFSARRTSRTPTDGMPP